MRPTFVLPPDISFSKQAEGGGWSFYFRHATLGELGRIRVNPHPSGQSQLIVEVSGDPADPMTAQRSAIFKPLALRIAGTIPSAADMPDPMLPPASSGPGYVVENKMLQCRTCGAFVARLVFAPNATDPGGFEDYVRGLFPSFAKWPVPTWLIGPDLRPGDPDGPNDILQVLPERGPIQRLTPADLNPRLDALMEQHCAPATKRRAIEP